MKLKFALISSVLILIVFVSTDMFIENNIFIKQLSLEKYDALIKNENRNGKKAIPISSILKPVLLLEDVEVTNMQISDDNTVKVEIKFNSTKNLKPKLEIIEKIDGFKCINELRIICLENKENVAVMDVSFVK